jgi:hypothetical protein
LRQLPHFHICLRSGSSKAPLRRVRVCRCTNRLPRCSCDSWALGSESVEQLKCGICARLHRFLVGALDVDHVVATSEPEMRRRRRWRRRRRSAPCLGWRRRRTARIVGLIAGPRRRWRRRTCVRSARGRRGTGVCAWSRWRRRSKLTLRTWGRRHSPRSRRHELSWRRGWRILGQHAGRQRNDASGG